MSATPAARPFPLFTPTRRRVTCAIVFASLAFFLPQPAPLVWYPLNRFDPDALYLELTCRADQPGQIEVFYGTTTPRRQELIRIPIAPTSQAFTYAFPLVDAPLTFLRLDPVAHGATTDVRRLEIINGAGEVRHAFSAADLAPVREIDSVTPQNGGWLIKTLPHATDPQLQAELTEPIIAPGTLRRNLQRCLLSTGYLGLLAWILLLSVHLAFHRATPWRAHLAPVAFVTLLALLFALIGNRGLIRASLRSALAQAPWPLITNTQASTAPVAFFAPAHR